MSEVKNARPSELVAVGPLKPCITSTGCCGVTASSSASVGMRGAAGGGVNWLMLKPPSAVSHCPAGISRRPRGEGVEHLGDRARVLDARVVARPQAEQHDVVVVVDDARHRGAPAQVDLARAVVVAVARIVADRDEAAVADQDRGHHPVPLVQGVDLAVDQAQRLAERAALVAVVVVGEQRGCRRGTAASASPVSLVLDIVPSSQRSTSFLYTPAGPETEEAVSAHSGSPTSRPSRPARRRGSPRRARCGCSAAAPGLSRSCAAGA